jgi:hypothetical protein
MPVPRGRRQKIDRRDAELLAGLLRELLDDRSEDDCGAIASLLSSTDWLLGDFLGMRLIRTVNCPLDRLDPAVTRSGRLLACREFARVPRERAQRIANEHGLALQPQADYSLAEVSAGPPKTDAADARTIRGFALSQSQTV